MRTSMMVMMSSKCVWRALVVMQLLVCSTIALKCKCTQSSGTVKCVDGVCEISTHPAACLMLDHAVTGVHYACSQSDLPSEQCQKRTTKSGVEVNVCSCNSDDFCNYKNWPLKKMETKLNNDDHAITPAPVTVSTASTNTPLLATFLAFLVFRYFFTFPRI